MKNETATLLATLITNDRVSDQVVELAHHTRRSRGRTDIRRGHREALDAGDFSRGKIIEGVIVDIRTSSCGDLRDNSVCVIVNIFYIYIYIYIYI